jgi:hypothetical protein
MSTSDIILVMTVYGKPSDLVETVNGPVTYRKWLENEADRVFRKSRWPTRIITNEATGEIALAQVKAGV